MALTFDGAAARAYVNEVETIFNAGSAGKCKPVDGTGIGGSVVGISPQKVVCANKTTKKKVTIQLNGATSWDCEAAGLAVNAGDTIIQSVRGVAD